MIVADLVEALERVAPIQRADDWDNVGLLVGVMERELTGPSLLSIDFTEDVLDEAIRADAGAVISYHPPIFHPIKSLTDKAPHGRTLLRAIESGLAVYSPHTALDAAPGGVTDWLCDMLAPDDAAGAATIGDRRALRPHAKLDPRHTHKVVTFAPADRVEELRNALASIGAGRIGAYERCSFGVAGQGTFFGGAGTAPATGQPGRLETVDEIRLEMVCPGEALGLAMEMIRRFHPYDEPAFDVHPLGAKPDRSAGAGRRLVLDQPATPVELAQRLKRRLGVDAVKLAQASPMSIERIGVCPGAGASLLESAMAEGCQAFVTGEMRHHEVMGALERGCSILLAGHTNTERGYLPIYADRINELAPEARAIVSEVDKAVFRTL